MRTALIVALFFVSIGCSQSASPPSDEQDTAAKKANTPESVYRRFMLANLSGDETMIRPLILEHEDAHVLWQGDSYPDKVAAVYVEEYRTMQVWRVDSPDEKRVLLRSTAAPFPLAAVKVKGLWRIDVSPIIDFRQGTLPSL